MWVESLCVKRQLVKVCGWKVCGWKCCWWKVCGWKVWRWVKSTWGKVLGKLRVKCLWVKWPLVKSLWMKKLEVKSAWMESLQVSSLWVKCTWVKSLWAGSRWVKSKCGKICGWKISGEKIGVNGMLAFVRPSQVSFLCFFVSIVFYFGAILTTTG